MCGGMASGADPCRGERRHDGDTCHIRRVEGARSGVVGSRAWSADRLASRAADGSLLSSGLQLDLGVVDAESLAVSGNSLSVGGFDGAVVLVGEVESAVAGGVNFEEFAVDE